MPSCRFFQLDVFTRRPGGGNPLGVVVAADDWSDAAMQAFAKWTDIVETTFLLRPSTPEASYRLRIFTPTKEIAFAGHPSIGSAHVALLSGFSTPKEGVLIQECQAGLLPIRVEGESAERHLFIRAPKATVLKTGVEPKSLLANTLKKVKLGKLPPAFVEGGRRWWLAEFADASELRAWQPDHASIRKIGLDSDSLGLCVFARSNEPGHDVVLRAFPAGAGIVEDPASGAANGLVAAYIAHAEPDGPLARGYVVSQGREIEHDAELILRIDADATVWVGGQTQTVVSGEVEWPN
ncbi:MAG TPA: PhzF family phenazine biosynthesis protein [Dokdonella sp.]|uniref:PhzF family phenazine biosynthesis protein n=1 Tax=Dokdonella sp. TaxID=2291710 RepID=UPI002D7FC824|nr:PhzF family phenazine biosynthesis protein [Dokdonella sp.]HET9032518.1 PhzF family phenazine biosynthesis protein [Dokdonella sp.]